MDQKTRNYLDGLASFRVVFMQLAKGTKRTTRSWKWFEDKHDQRGESRLDLALKWLKEGYGVGYLPRNRLAVLDADAPETVRRILDFEKREGALLLPKVRTPSGGLHALFVHPDEIDVSHLKNHICHPKENGTTVPWDLKLGERTMLVAPGTITPKGIYTAGDWTSPPTLDVRRIAPQIEIYKSLPSFLRDTRPLRDRIINAMVYLKTAPISVKGNGSRTVLRQIARRLVAYHDLDPGLAFHLLTVNKGGHIAWNNRCIGADGKLHPWDPDDLLDALYDALDAAPEYGIYLFNRKQARSAAFQSFDTLVALLTFLPEPIGEITMRVGDLYRFFIEYFKVDATHFGDKEFGSYMGKVIEEGRIPFVVRDRNNRDGRIYRGMDLNMLQYAVRMYEQHQKSFAFTA